MSRALISKAFIADKRVSRKNFSLLVGDDMWPENIANSGVTDGRTNSYLPGKRL
jgi:hypothetical protein